MHKISKSFTVLFAFSFIALKLNAGAIITTVAGNGTEGDTVTNTTSAQTIATSKAITRSLTAPTGLAVDNQGNVYIADTLNNKIKKLDPNGNLTDLGGSFSLGNSVVGLAADASGNLYIADYNNGLIKKRDSIGVFTTIAGDGGADNKQYLEPIAAAGVSLVRPMGMALDQSGNLYIADKGNSSIRKLQLSSSFISTTAGRAGTLAGRSVEFSGDGSQAVDADLWYSFGVAVDSVRNVIYIADTYNHRVRKVDSLGVITTVVGSINGTGDAGNFDQNPQGFRGDGGPATSAMLDNPRGVAVDSAGNLYIADSGNAIIRKVDTNGIITTVAGTIPVPNGVSPNTTNAQFGYSGDGGPATSAKLDGPFAVACDSAGNLYIADTGNTRVRKVTFATTNVDTTFTTLAGTAGGEGSADGTGSAALFKYPNGVAVDATGNVYIADESNHTIRKITSGGVVTTLAGTAGSSGSTDGTGSAARFTGPTGVAVDVEGNVYVADRANHSIRKITSGGVVTTLAGSSAGDTGSSDGTGSDARFLSPRSVAVDVEGIVYVADTANHTIRKITAAGVTTFAGSAGSLGSTDGTGSAARFNQPRGVAVDAARNVYVADWVNHTIRKITFDGEVTTLAGTAGSSGSTDGTGSAARFNRPLGVAVDAAGNVYVTDGSNHTIRKITSGGVVTTLGGTAGSTGSTDGIGSAAQFDSPAGVAVDAAGNLYVADQSNHTIRKSSLQPFVTTPTSANLAATTATLGGNVISDTGYGVTARGVVYAVTATNATPQLDGTGVINVAGTGTTGEFTVNVTGLTAGTAYSYAAYATNLAGTAYTSVGTFTTPPLAVPGAPTGVAAVRGAGEAVVSFTAPLSNGGAAITSYTVTASPSGLTALTATGTSSPITITGLTNGTSYTFTVTATNSVGAGSASSASSAITPTAGSLAGVTFSNTGSGSTAEVKATAVDAAGNIYLTGYFSYGDATSFSIGGVTLPKIGARDAWVAKLDSTRTVVWAKNFGGSGAQTQTRGLGIAVDMAGNVYLAGDFNRGNLTTPELAKIGEDDAFALKLDSSGATIWAKNFGGSGAYVTGSGIAVDPIGNVYLGGNFSDGNLTTLALTMLGRRDAFAIKLDGSGTTTWAKNYGGSGARAWGLSIAVDGSGNVYLGGRFQSANLTTPALMKLGTLDAFALKLDSSGATTWARNYGGSGASAAGNGIAVDTIGNVYLGGSFDQSLTTPALTKLGTQDAFALKLDSSGATTWAKNFGGSGARAAGASIAVDGSGNIYLGGYFDQSSLTTPALTRIGTLDGFALKLDNSGTTTWAKNYGGSGASAYLGSIAADRSGNVFLGGHFESANLTTPALTLSSSFSPFLIAAYLPEPAPTVTSVSPSTGSGAGGTAITITGTDFTGATGVTIGGVAATNVTVVSATSITATTPAGTAGAASVLVTTSNGTNTANTLYSIRPTVTQSLSNLAINATTLTITGTGFSTTAANNTVTLSSGTGTVTSATATQLTVTFNSQPVEATLSAVVTTNGIGSGSEMEVATIVLAPSITSISPAAGPTAGGTTITIAGSNFGNVTAVTISGIAATNFTVNNGQTITATTPAGTRGAANVVVTTADGSSSITAATVFNYTAGAFVKPAVRFSPAFPHALSITAPGSGVTTSTSFTVTFNQSVTGVDAADFSLIATGTVANGTISSITGSGATYTVNVTGITGVGTLGLNLVNLPTITAAPSFATQVTYPTGTKPASVTLGDVNGDGRLDLITANFDSSTASVLLGNGNGTFQTKTDFVTGTNPQSVALGDVNGDGRLDLITANSGSATASVFLGNGTGTFGAKTDFSTGTTPRSVKLADVNGDGTLDIVTANQGSQNVSLLLGTGDGSFARKEDLSTIINSQPTSVTLGDVNRDGKLDIVTGSSSGSNAGLRLGNGDGTFRALSTVTTGNAQPSVTLGDVNGDGKLDGVFTKNGDQVHVALGNGDGTFQAISSSYMGTNPRSVTLGDVNGDGKLDLVTVNNGSANASVRLGDGNGTFEASVTFATGTYDSTVFGAATLGDVNGDGRLDLITANSGANTVSVLLGTGGSAIWANFSPQQTLTTGASPRSVAMGDVNNDGKLDLITANYDGSTVGVLLGSGNSTFQTQVTYASGTNPLAVTLADVNSDGKLDIIAANSEAASVSVLLGSGTGTFSTKTDFTTGTTPSGVTLGDVNGDGRLDLITANYGSANASVLLSNGDGTFRAKSDWTTGVQPRSVQLSDVNSDGKLDLITANFSSNTASVLLGNGDGTFQTQATYATGSQPIFVTLGDVNGDGRLDLITANSGTTTASVLLGNVNGTFQNKADFTTGSAPYAVALGDMNGDGKLDLIASNDGSNTASVLMGNGDGTFGAKTDFSTGTNPRSVQLGDVNGDGRLDLITANHGSANVSVLSGGLAFTGQTATVVATPPFVSSPTSASIGNTSATLGGDVTGTGNASLTAVGVVYAATSANSNPQLSGTGVTNLAGTAATGVFTVNATGLTAGTAYSYAAYATNSVGTTYTSVGTFTTTVPTPTLTFTTPSTASVAVGATRTNVVTSTLSGGSYGAVSYTSSDTGKATVNATTGVVTGVAVGSTTITATQAAAAGFNATTSTSYTLTVTIGTPTISAAPSASSIIYGQTLASSTLSGGTASVPGTFAFTTPSTAPGVGTAAQGVTFTPTDPTNYTSMTTTVNVTVVKATPAITVAPTASGITYGQTLAASTLSGGTASTAGTFTFTTVSTAPNAGTSAQGVTFTPSGTALFNTTTTTVNVTVAKATPTITWATPSAITYGTALSATQLNATGSVAGTIAYSPASGTTPSAGTQTLTATFTPTDTANYNSATRTVSLVVGKGTPTITWATPSAITFGTALSATQLNATGSVAGTIAYSPASGTTPSAGTQTLTATFTPTDTANYNPATGTVSLTVNKATPTIAWATPSAITFGTALSATQLNATGSVAGTIAYSPASGTTPSAGTQTLTATFTPTDTANYNPATGTVSLTVNKATPTITWATPSAITFGTALSATQLNATGSVAGTIAYSPASGTTPSAGTQTLTATFTPTDTANYNPATGTVSLTVNKATPTIAWATPSAITFGTALSATQLNATGSVAGTIAYSPASGTTPSAGTQTLTATFTPTDAANYNPATGTVSLTVNKATPTITWATPSAITFGTALSATQLNATASVAGAFVYSPASGSIPSVGTQTLSATFTPTDTANYNPASASVALSVAVAVPGSPTAITVTTANGEATVTFTAPSNPGSSAITGYTIRATASDGSIVTVNATGSPAKVTGLTPGKSYRFTVTANNSAGSSDTGTTSDGLTISLVNQTISFTAPADRTSNSGSFTLAATASSGLPVTFTVVSGPALLTGNVLDLTGASGTVKIRASQAGNATYAAAPAVEVSFAVTAGSAQVVLSSVVNPSTQKSEGTLGVVLTGNSRTGVLLLVSSGNGPSGTAEFTLGAGGSFTASFESSSTPSGLPLERGVQAASVTYTFTGTFVNNVLTGSIQPLGYGFKAEAPVNPPASATSVGLYTSAALSAESGTVYSLVGSNNEVLVLVKTPTVTTGGLTTLKADGSYTLAATTTSGSVTLSGGVNPTTTATTATLTLPGNTKVDFSGLSTTTKRTDRLIGLASRSKVGTGESVLITGVAIGGTDSKRVLIRAGGPALAAFGLASTLPNPTIKIYRGSTLIAQNDDWNPADAAEMGRLGLFAFPNGSKDAAILTTLAPGGYTAHISDQSGTGTGVALAEIYDASVNPAAEDQRLVSIASRGTVTPGDGALIGGFVVTGNSPKTLLIRGIGPALTAFGVAGALADPSLTIYQDSKVITTNEGWANSAAIAAAAIQTGAFALPSTSKDAAVLLTLSPGAYSAQVKSAKNASSGVALIEIYEVP
jgi:hypothetical protein